MPAIAANKLGEETSPYLLQHKDNPVHWQPWGQDALAAAAETGKPILLSVGYAACHWCHVMAHESFEDDTTAAVMNEKFINIKVDREERPDIDTIYQNALALMGQHGGWPLTMFLNEKGEPFWGGTYFPKDDRYGRAPFVTVLDQIHDAYTNRSDHVIENTRSLLAGLNPAQGNKASSPLTPDLIDQIATVAQRMIDPVLGGTQGAPKFPQVSFFQMMWRAARHSGRAPFKDAVVNTLDHICQGGIYDHLGGGFARYSTDEEWLAPHFEKMLYDNALLISLLSDVWTATQSPLYEARIRETVEWLRRDMTVEHEGEHAFASAYDADSEGEEGRFYVWQEAEIDALLGADAPLFKNHYDVTPTGNWPEGGPGVTILNRSARPEFDIAPVEEKLNDARQILLSARLGRVPPEWDDKVLADWNGLTISALARAGAVFGEPTWIARAESAFRFILANMRNGETLRHAWRNGQSRNHAVLDDYAAMAHAAVSLFEVTGTSDYLAHAQTWVAHADAYYADPAGGYFLTHKDATDLITRPKPVYDNAVPSGNSVMADVLARLSVLSGDAAYADRADALIQAATPDDPRALINSPGLVSAFDLLLNAVQIVVVGPDTDARSTLLQIIWRSPGMNNIVFLCDDTNALPADHPAHAKQTIDGKPTVYICRGQTCGLPLTDPTALKRALESD